jgi:prefoldin subunit 5
MSTNAPPPATGPILLAHIEELEADIERLTDRIDRQLSKLDQVQAQLASFYNAFLEQNRLLHQFLDPSMDIQAWLKMMKESYRRQVEALQAVEEAVRNEHYKTRRALEIHMSDPGRAEAVSEQELSRGN